MRRAVWGGALVVVTLDYGAVRAGTEGVNLGRREKDEEGRTTVLVRLEDDREVRIPIDILEPVQGDYVPDAIQWKPDLPIGRHIRLVVEATRGGYRYELWGSSERWFTVRWPLAGGRGERTTFQKNRRLARQVFDDLTT